MAADPSAPDRSPHLDDHNERAASSFPTTAAWLRVTPVNPQRVHVAWQTDARLGWTLHVAYEGTAEERPADAMDATSWFLDLPAPNLHVHATLIDPGGAVQQIDDLHLPANRVGDHRMRWRAVDLDAAPTPTLAPVRSAATPHPRWRSLGTVDAPTPPPGSASLVYAEGLQKPEGR